MILLYLWEFESGVEKREILQATCHKDYTQICTLAPREKKLDIKRKDASIQSTDAIP